MGQPRPDDLGDQLRHLCRVQGSSPEQTAAYAYDAFNRLVGETVTNTPPAGQGQPSVTQTAYVYDGSQVLLQFDATYADTTVGDGLGVGDLSHRYLWAVDQLLADEQAPAGGWGWDYYGNHLTGSGTTNWPLTDNQGSIRDIAEYDAQTGVTSIVDHLAYNSFGKLTSQTNAAVDSAFGYAGGMTDWASGLQLNGKRWYDPGAGTWLSEDPSGLGPDVNPYRYCGNSPTNGTDPTGLAEAEGAYNEDEDGDAAEEELKPNVPTNDRVGKRTGFSDLDPGDDTASELSVYDFDEDPCGTLPTMDGGAGARIGTLGQIGFGLLEVISGSVIFAGGGASEVGTLGAATPVSVPVMICGAVVACHGADNISAGLVTMVYGTPQHTLTYQTARATAQALGSGRPDAWGECADIAVPIVATAGAAAAPEAAAAADAAGAGRSGDGPVWRRNAGKPRSSR